MVMARLTNAADYRRLGGGIARALDFLQTADLAKLASGRHEVTDDVFASVSEYDTKVQWEGAWEAHRRHIDVHYLVYGEEHIGYAALSEVRAGTYDEDRDVLIVHQEGDREFVRLTPGRLLILFPHDVHMPGIAVGAPKPVKKIVMKIRVED